MSSSNGNLTPSSSSSTSRKSLNPGVYVPLNTFFLPTTKQDLDIPTYKRHATRIAQAGVGLVALGSMGEAVQLTHSERNQIVVAAREALNESGANLQLIVGTGASSTKETIELTIEAAERGADFAMVISPGYFAGALSKEALKAYFIEVAEASPIPILMYNYPGASAGIDLDSDLITQVALTCSNIVGIKLTCGSVGKLSRLTSIRPDFAVLGGFVDTLGPSMLVKSAGGITGTANIAPVGGSDASAQKSCVALYKATYAFMHSSDPSIRGSPSSLANLQRLQSIVSSADWALQKVGISGTKFALEKVHGYGGVARRPILPFDESEGKGKRLMKDLEEILALEKSL